MARRSGSGHRGRLAAVGATALAAAAIAIGAATAGPVAHAATAHTTATVKALAVSYTAPKRDLALGMQGTDVRALQERLSALKYYPGKIDGEYGPDTEAAIWAFQEINHIAVTGTLNSATKKALVKPRTYVSPSYKGKRATRIEVSQAREVLVYFLNGKIWFISHVSSGGGYIYGNGNRAITPNGLYNTTVYLPGWVTVPLGKMYNPVFFIGTEFAIHGDTYVPQGPASHGCVRIPMDTAAFFHKMIKTPGTQVYVYGTPQWES